jgi:competence protein CoiA
VQFAINAHGARIEAQPKLQGTCPICGCAVVPKCGQIKVRHWAHVAARDCDSWFEPETEWHRGWKERFRQDQIEVSIGEHRADIQSDDGTVIELQNSSISPKEIQLREAFYGQMIWVVNAQKFADRFFLMKQMSEEVFSFKWKQMKSSWRFAACPLFFDFGATDIRGLIGARIFEANDYITGFIEQEGEARSSIERYRVAEERKGYAVDPRFEDLPEELRSCSMFRKLTLYENGFGSVRAVSRQSFLASYGGGFESSP